MYVELYILDNWLMNLLILRLAACFLGTRPINWRIFIFSGLGAIYALLSLFFPILLHFVFKILLCFIMASAFKRNKWSNVFLHSGVVLISTMLAGGMTYALAFLLGGSLSGGYIVASIHIRVFIYAAALLSFMPNLIRRLRRRFIGTELEADVIITHNGESFILKGLIDTGNRLKDPLTALPGLLVNCPKLSKYADIPMVIHGAFNGATLFGFKPDSISVSGYEIAAFIYIVEPDMQFSGAFFQALIPPDVIPLNYKNNKENVKCRTCSERLLPGFWRQFSGSRLLKSIISVPGKLFRRH